jgi:signal transduction histidine kinase
MLDRSIQKLLKTNTDIFNSQKQFIENASHELQTPLAIGINKLELLAGENDLSPQHIRKIGDIIESLRRLSTLNKSLLLLSKIENKQFVSEEQLSFDLIFRRLIEDFSDFSEYRKIGIKYMNEGPWFIKINKDLANILIMNLVKNAIVYNQQGGEVVIKLSASSFTIENTSDEPPMNADKLFERFNKNPGSKNSTGLGLAIVKAISDLYGLSITYTYNGRHVFEVSSLLP